MKKIELVYRMILEEAIEKRNIDIPSNLTLQSGISNRHSRTKGNTINWNVYKKLTQAEIARALRISLSTVNLAIKHLEKMNAVRVKNRNFEIVNAKKILLYWASIRNLEKDIIYRTRVDESVVEIEKNMPSGVLYGGYSAYKFMFKDMPADYSEVYVYSNDVEEIKKRFKENKNEPNLFVLKREFDKMTKAQIFVDLWNLKEWYAKDFLKAMEEKIYGILE